MNRRAASPRLRALLGPGTILALILTLVSLAQAEPGRAARPGPASGRGGEGGELLNDTGIEVTKPKGGGDESLFLHCSGLDRYAHELRTIGLSRANLRKAVPCVPGDFDGNGYLDFAIWGELYKRPEDNFETRVFKVLFFERGRVCRSQTIDTPERDHLLLYDPPDEDEDEILEEPTSPYDGLMQLGEGDETYYYYVYDETTGILKRYAVPEE